jgi:hypothetical protein
LPGDIAVQVLNVRLYSHAARNAAGLTARDAVSALADPAERSRITDGHVGRGSMTTAPVAIRVERSGHKQVLLSASDPAREVSRLLRTYADASDITISIKLTDHEDLMVGLEAGQAFIGLVTTDGVYQYVADDAADGTCQFIIGDAPTNIATRYVLPVSTATGLLAQWLSGSPPLADLACERQ